jgi:hypothetical protein
VGDARFSTTSGRKKIRFYMQSSTKYNQDTDDIVDEAIKTSDNFVRAVASNVFDTLRGFGAISCL